MNNNTFTRVLLTFYACLLAGSLLTGCMGTTHVVTGTPLTPTHPETIKIYSKPPVSFKEIAVIDAEPTALIDIADPPDNDEAIQKMKEIAASLGANGILIRKPGNKAGTIGSGYGLSSTQTSTANSNMQADSVYHGVAIFVLEEE